MGSGFVENRVGSGLAYRGSGQVLATQQTGPMKQIQDTDGQHILSLVFNQALV